MQDTQVADKIEVMEKQCEAHNSKLNSRFNDAEYERWSQTLRNKTRSNTK
jgi:hypothetical protein